MPSIRALGADLADPMEHETDAPDVASASPDRAGTGQGADLPSAARGGATEERQGVSTQERPEHSSAPTPAPRRHRLFVGIEMSDEWRVALERLAGQLRGSLGSGCRWVRPDLYHVTIAFIGERPTEDVTSICEATRCAAATTRPFVLRLGSLEGPGGRRSSPLVVRVEDPSGGLQALRARLDGELAARGIPFDHKRLAPHITLARPRRGSAPPPALPARHPLRVALLDVSHIVVVESDLRSDGPRYTVLERADLG
ncbi:MAG: RNA 2',3'-cyclic phosphodiesterase [Chloroflexi bacterium]|nr:RNA 2',3'-cyclic phosphodiesterase [Chloroflexota bacterium]